MQKTAFNVIYDVHNLDQSFGMSSTDGQGLQLSGAKLLNCTISTVFYNDTTMCGAI